MGGGTGAGIDADQRPEVRIVLFETDEEEEE